MTMSIPHPVHTTADMARVPYLLWETYHCFLSQKSLQQPLKNRPYFKKVSPRSQIRDYRVILQRSDIQDVTVFLQTDRPKMCYYSSLFGRLLTVRRIASNGQWRLQ